MIKDQLCHLAGPFSLKQKIIDVLFFKNTLIINVLIHVNKNNFFLFGNHKKHLN